MGFLDNLLRREVRKVISNAVDTVVDDTLKNAFGKDGGSSVANAGGSTSGSSPEKENREATKLTNCSGEELLRRRIEEIAARDWSDYELRRQVPSSEVNAPEGSEPFFEYGFYQGGALVAVIKILNDNNAYCRRSVRLAQAACRGQNVKYMNFMSYMMNRPEYIAKRFADNIR